MLCIFVQISNFKYGSYSNEWCQNAAAGCRSLMYSGGSSITWYPVSRLILSRILLPVIPRERLNHLDGTGINRSLPAGC